MRAFIATVVLCALGVGFFGAPVWRKVEKDRSVPFPCQDRPCGCLDAASCWKECCCFTHEQKLAWAAEHGVQPPAVVAVNATERGDEGSLAEACIARRGDDCCHRDSSSKNQRENERNGERNGGAAAKGVDDVASGSLVLAADWRLCRGLGALWLVLSHALPVAPASPPSLEAAMGRIDLLSDSAREIAAPPSSPPPRRA